MLWTFCICTPSALYLDDPCNQDTEIELIQLGWICFSDILRQSLDGGDLECISGEEAVLQVVRIPRIPAQEAGPQFLNENYNQHSNANCQCQGRFDAKRDLPGSFQIGKTAAWHEIAYFPSSSAVNLKPCSGGWTSLALRGHWPHVSFVHTPKPPRSDSLNLLCLVHMVNLAQNGKYRLHGLGKHGIHTLQT